MYKTSPSQPHSDLNYIYISKSNNVEGPTLSWQLDFPASSCGFLSFLLLYYVPVNHSSPEKKATNLKTPKHLGYDVKETPKTVRKPGSVPYIYTRNCVDKQNNRDFGSGLTERLASQQKQERCFWFRFRGNRQKAGLNKRLIKQFLAQASQKPCFKERSGEGRTEEGSHTSGREKGGKTSVGKRCDENKTRLWSRFFKVILWVKAMHFREVTRSKKRGITRTRPKTNEQCGPSFQNGLWSIQPSKY